MSIADNVGQRATNRAHTGIVTDKQQQRNPSQHRCNAEAQTICNTELPQRRLKMRLCDGQTGGDK